MSIWAERFAALSGTRANSAKSANRSDCGEAGPFGSYWQSVSAKKSAVPIAPKPAEILDFANSARPSGTIGTFGNGRDAENEQRLATEPEPAPPVVPIAAERSDHLEERAAIIEEATDAPTRWAEGCAVLVSMSPPTGFSPERWRRVVDAAGAFLDRWAAEAIRCGWNSLDAFGCHSTAPDRRFDCMGLVLLLDRCEIIAVDPAGATLVVTATGSRQRFYRRPMPPETVPLWRLWEKQGGDA